MVVALISGVAYSRKVCNSSNQTRKGVSKMHWLDLVEFLLGSMFSLSLVGGIVTMNARKVGGIWFSKVGRFQFSFCKCGKKNKVKG
jgi:hypothetical protein